MTNGGFIFFKTPKDTNIAYKKIKNYKISGYLLFEVNQKNKFSVYYRINLKTYINLKKENIDQISKIKLNKYIDYEKKIHLNKNEKKINSKEIKEFLDKIKLIKTTGKHTFEGNVFFKNFKINKKINNIENHKIFNLINDYYS